MEIENVSVEEIVNYLRRLMRVYVILLILEVIFTITNKELVYWDIVTIILYAANLLGLYVLAKSPCIMNTYAPSATAFALAVLDTAHMVDLIIVKADWYALFALISIVVQLSTLYITHKLREKMNSGQPDIEAGGAPVAVAVANPMGQGAKA